MADRPRERRPRLREAAITPKEDQEQAPAVASATAEPEPPSDAPERVSFYLGKDGVPLWDRMHAGTREKIEKLTGKGAGAGAMSAGTQKTLAAVTVGSIPTLAAVVATALGYTRESAERITLTEKQKTELTALYEQALMDNAISLGKYESLFVALGATVLYLAPSVQQLEKRKPNGAAGAPYMPPAAGLPVSEEVAG